LRQQATAVQNSFGCPSTTTTISTASDRGSTPTSSQIEQSQEQSIINLRKLTENNMLLSSLNEIAKQGK
jgi:uncharacterized membrane protein YjjP (DUF1212 family)